MFMAHFLRSVEPSYEAIQCFIETWKGNKEFFASVRNGIKAAALLAKLKQAPE